MWGTIQNVKLGLAEKWIDSLWEFDYIAALWKKES